MAKIKATIVYGTNEIRIQNLKSCWREGNHKEIKGYGCLKRRYL